MTNPVKVSDLPAATSPLVGTELVMIVQSGTSRRTTAGDIATSLGFANPTGTVGLTAVNGSAGTAMRSDAAPPLSQSIAPTWTGVHTFSNNVALNGTTTVSGTSIRDTALFTSGTLGVTRGGTGVASFTQGDLIYSSAANTLAALAKSATATRYLSNTGASNNPAWAQVDLTNGVTGTLPATSGGTGIASGTSGGVPYFSASTTIASSAALGANQIVLGGGAGTAPATLGSLGTTTTVLHGNAAGAPTFGAVVLTTDVSGILPAANGGTANGFTAFTGPTTSTKTFTLPDATATILTSNAAVTVAQGGTGITSGTSGAVPYFSSTSTIASSALLAANQIVLGGGAGTAPATLGSLGTTTTVLHGNAAGAPTFGTVVLTTDVSGILPGANGGTNNGFMAFTGPATSLKTFTLPNASATILTTNAAVTVVQGGTGLTTVAQGDMLYASAADTLTALAKDTNATRYLSNTGTSNNPAWAQVNAANGVTGILPLANGGFGLTNGLRTANKSNTESRNSTTTSANDSSLIITTLDTGTHAVDILVQLGGVAAGGFRFQLSQTGTMTGTVSYVGNINGATVTGTTTGLNTDNTFAALSGGNTEYLRITARVSVTVTGTLGFAWAQNSSNVSNTSVFIGHMTAFKLQ